MSGLNNEIFIEDITEGTECSLYDLATKLTPIGKNQHGSFTTEKKLENAFIKFENIRWKLEGYKAEYFIGKPIDNIIEIDFAKELVGVIEYLSKGKKKSIFKKGVIKENDI